MQDVTTTVGVVPALEDALVNFYAFPASTQAAAPMPMTSTRAAATASSMSMWMAARTVPLRGDDNGDAGDSEDNHGHDAENGHTSDAGSDANRTDGASGGMSAAQSHDSRSGNGDTHGRRSAAGPTKQVLPQTGDTLAGGAATVLAMGLAMVVAALGTLRQRKAR